MSESSRLQVDCRGRLAVVEEEGSGPAMVIVGAAAPIAWSREAAKATARRGFRVVNFDYGEGHDDPDHRSALAQVDDVVSVMAAAGLDRAHAVGLSRGAITAYGLAARHPQLVESLVLAFPVAGFADTLYSIEPQPQPEPGESEADSMARSLGQVFSEAFLEASLAQAIALVSTSPGSVARVERAEEEPFSDDDVVRAPTLVLVGADDRVVGRDHSNRYLEAVTGSIERVIEGASHGWLMEAPEEFADLVAEWADSIA